MDQVITAEQKEQLKTWAGQRDAILLEISGLRDEKKDLQTMNGGLALSCTDIENRMNEVKGRIEELKQKEVELLSLVSKEVASLQSQKSTLEAEIPLLKQVIEALTSQKTLLDFDVALALSQFNSLKDQALLLEKLVAQTNEVGKNNSEKVNLLLSDLAKSLEEIVSVNKKNVFETNVVIEKLPAMMMELQKRGLIKNKT